MLIEIAASLFDSALCIYFVTKFNRASFRVNKLWLLTLLVHFGFTLFSDKFMSGFNVLSSLILTIIACTYAIIVSRKKLLRAILSVCIYEAALILLSSLLYLIISMAIKNFDLLMQGSVYIGRYIYLVLHKISLFSVLKLFLYIFRSDTSLDIKSGITTFVFTLTTILGLGATMSVTALPNANKIQTPILIITVSFVVSNMFLYIMISQVQKLQKNKYELKLLEDKTNFEEARYNDANTIWANIKKVQHDIKQHLTVIGNYLNDNNIDECQEYIHNLLPNVEQMGNLVKSDNTILDYLINSKLCALKDTQVIVSGSVGNLSDIKDSDLACLMGNILDNAIEALENVREKRIELLFMIQNSNRVIICKNTIEHSVLATNKELNSTKKNRDNHGYGHQIIAKIVSEYYGMIEYFEESDMFGVQIVLPIVPK